MKSPIALRAGWVRVLPAALMAAIVSGCDRYTFTINEQPVHSPTALFSDYRIADGALRDCIAQTITDLRIHQASELTRLVCTHAQIADLSGLEAFVALSELNLAENDIQSIQPLLALTNLTAVDLSANPRLDCGSARTLKGQVDSLKQPAHCEK